MAEIDAYCALAEVSIDPNMTKPKILSMLKKPTLKIKGMRHPLLEKKYEDDFVPNDIELNFDDQRSLLITGPNMGGKSTTLRTTCLVLIMA